MTEGQIAHPLSAARMLAITAGALVVASLIVFGAILPAEFNQDPTGLGRLTGLSRLFAPRQVPFDVAASAVPIARDFPAPFRTDTIEFPMLPDGNPAGGDQLEYKVRMKKDATFIYEWSVANIPTETEFYFDFHGHTIDGKTEMTVATYKQATGTSANGALTAPFDGIHGWFFQNQSLNKVIVRLKISGFYDLVEPGDPGNESHVIANVPAEQALGKK